MDKFGSNLKTLFLRFFSDDLFAFAVSPVVILKTSWRKIALFLYITQTGFAYFVNTYYKILDCDSVPLRVHTVIQWNTSNVVSQLLNLIQCYRKSIQVIITFIWLVTWEQCCGAEMFWFTLRWNIWWPMPLFRILSDFLSFFLYWDKYIIFTFSLLGGLRGCVDLEWAWGWFVLELYGLDGVWG